MKIAVFFTVAVIIACLLYCRIKSYKHNNDVARAICKMVIPGIITVILAAIMFFFGNRTISLIAHSLYFISTDWLIYKLLVYVIVYVGEDFNKYIKKPVLYALLIADSLYLLSNIFTEKVFTVTNVILNAEFSYFQFKMRPLYLVHGCFIYAMIICIFITLVHKIFHTGSVYRKKYIYITIIFSLIVDVNAIILYLGNGIDVSVLGYAVIALLIYYYSLVYMPKILKQQTMSLVVDDMTEGLIVLDENNMCIYINVFAQKVLGVNDSRHDLADTIAEEWIDINNLKECDEKTINYLVEVNGDERYYKVYYGKILDEKSYHLGSYFLIQDFSEENRRIKEEHYKATHDVLTGLYTKEYFFEKAEEALNEYPNEIFLVICSDIYNFKMVNDLIGWEYGNEVLVHIAEAFRMRATPGEVYGYMGSDRFAIVVRKSQYDEEWFRAMAGDITYTKEDISYVLNIYFGIYEVNDRSIPVSAMCDRAYLILNTIKGSYTQRIAYYTDEVREKVIRENELVGALDGALDNEEFVIYLQPQVDVNRRLIGAEALVRWKHPDKGFVAPGEFIPIFEKKNVISKLDVYIWHQACKLLKRWKSEGRSNLSLSVNISPKNLYTLDVYKIFMDLVAKYEINPQNLRLEITETAIMTDLTKQNDLIRKLQKAGFYVEMDDFGSGYSSLNMLKELSLDVIKIDRMFLADSTNAARSRYILEAVIKLSKQLKMEIIAEGVESKEQVELLTELGCDVFQGYYFDKPIPIPEFEAKYLK